MTIDKNENNNDSTRKTVKRKIIIIIIGIIVICALLAFFLLPKMRKQKIRNSLENQFAISVDSVEYEKVGRNIHAREILHTVNNVNEDKKVYYSFHASFYALDGELHTIDGYTDFDMKVISTNYDVEMYVGDIYEEIKEIVNMKLADTDFYVSVSNDPSYQYDLTTSYEDFKNKTLAYRVQLKTYVVLPNTITEDELLSLELELANRRWPFSIIFEAADTKYVEAISEIGYISMIHNYNKLEALFDQEQGNTIFLKYDGYFDYVRSEVKELTQYHPNVITNNEYLYIYESQGDLSNYMPIELVLNNGTDKECIIALRKDMVGMLSDSLGNRYIVLNSKDILKKNTIELGSYISFIADGEEMIRQEVNDDTVYDEQTIFVQESSIVGNPFDLQFGFMRQTNY